MLAKGRKQQAMKQECMFSLWHIDMFYMIFKNTYFTALYSTMLRQTCVFAFVAGSW